MGKKIKLNLKSLEVESFITTEKARGGAVPETLDVKCRFTAQHTLCFGECPTKKQDSVCLC